MNRKARADKGSDRSAIMPGAVLAVVIIAIALGAALVGYVLDRRSRPAGWSQRADEVQATRTEPAERPETDAPDDGRTQR
jgi:hypothetical protein